MYAIKFIEPQKISSILPLLLQLSPNTPKSILEDRLKEMLLQGYKCVGVYQGDLLIGISGIWILTKYYIGKHIEPDNVFILPEYQGKGIGKLLINWILNYAKSIGCVGSELNCYKENKVGQKFWKDQGYQTIAYHFQKKF